MVQLQAIFFQLIFFIIMMLFMFAGIILMLVAIPWSNLSSNPEPGSVFFLSMIFMFIFFPLWIIFGIYAAIASIKSYQGKIFKYAVIGSIIQRKVYTEN